MKSIFLPGSRIGVMGGGQLGRMFAIAARKMGYRVHTFSPDEDTPTGQLADLEIAAPYEDKEAVCRFAKGIDILTFEFENIPAQTINWCSEFCAVRPSGKVLHIAQNRLREKEFLVESGLPVAPFIRVNSAEELALAIEKIGTPSVLKSAYFGYDGKGQLAINPNDDLQKAWNSFEGQSAVLEKFIYYTKELSILIARGIDGKTVTYPVCENIHHNHILDITVVPARIEENRNAEELAIKIAEKIDLVGLLAVEMFMLEDGTLLINEIAPRPHNSGHFSFDACVTSQFEQQLRAVCGLSLGSTELLRPVAMANLLGDLWERGEPNWKAAAEFPNVKIHLYGKSAPRKGRKMGHLLAFGKDTQEAVDQVQMARECLTKR